MFSDASGIFLNSLAINIPKLFHHLSLFVCSNSESELYFAPAYINQRLAATFREHNAQTPLTPAILKDITSTRKLAMV